MTSSPANTPCKRLPPIRWVTRGSTGHGAAGRWRGPRRQRHRRVGSRPRGGSGPDRRAGTGGDSRAAVPHRAEHHHAHPAGLLRCRPAGASTRAALTGRTIARLVFTLVIIAALATTLVSQPGSPLRNTSQIAAGGASVALILLFVRGGRTPR